MDEETEIQINNEHAEKIKKSILDTIKKNNISKRDTIYCLTAFLFATFFVLKMSKKDMISLLSEMWDIIEEERENWQ